MPDQPEPTSSAPEAPPPGDPADAWLDVEIVRDLDAALVARGAASDTRTVTRGLLLQARDRIVRDEPRNGRSAPPLPASVSRENLRAVLLRDWADVVGPGFGETHGQEATDVALTVAMSAVHTAAAHARIGATVVAETSDRPAGPVVGLGRAYRVEHLSCAFCAFGPLGDGWHAAVAGLYDGDVRPPELLDHIPMRVREGVLCGFCLHGRVARRWLFGSGTPEDIRQAADQAHQANVIRVEVIAR